MSFLKLKALYFNMSDIVHLWGSFLNSVAWIQVRHSKFEPDKAQYSTPNFFDWLFLMRVCSNPKFRQGPGLGGLSSRGDPGMATKEL